MRYFSTLKGARYAYTVDDINISLLPKPKELPYKKHTLLDSIITFDIETTTIDEYTAFMYHWQMCIDGYNVYGRTWEEWVKFIIMLEGYYDLSAETNVIIWVHNLGFEFQFMKEYLKQYFGGYTVFASQTRKPISIRCNNGIEFRCSYKLSNMSLEKAVNNELGTIYKKAVGDLDYDVIRYPSTTLSYIEFGYCMLDTLSLFDYIKNKLRNNNDTLATIPMTSTGYVRRYCRNNCKRDPTYFAYFKRQEMSESIYKLLKACGRGGDTSSNYRYTGIILTDVDSYDIKSSYPFQMASKQYPSRKFYRQGVVSEDELKEAIHETPAIIVMTFFGLAIKDSSVCAYISDSKVLSMSTIHQSANGRLYYADSVTMCITDIDYRIINSCYSYEAVEIGDIYLSKYAPLHAALRYSILNLFQEKCVLELHKNEGDNKYLYAKKKNEVNGTFGMMYTDPVRDLIEYNDEWILTHKPIKEALTEYYENRNNFLTYAHGVWTTAHARAQLNDLRILTGEGTAYWDTDSSKAVDVNPKLIEQANNDIIEYGEKYGCHVTVEGKDFYLGTYDHDAHYDEFITLGAKKYAYTDKKGLHVTISGVNKKLGAKELSSISNFKPGFIFHQAGGNTLYYRDSAISSSPINGHSFSHASSISMLPSTYKLGLTREFAEKIGYLQNI